MIPRTTIKRQLDKMIDEHAESLGHARNLKLFVVHVMRGTIKAKVATITYSDKLMFDLHCYLWNIGKEDYEDVKDRAVESGCLAIKHL